MILCITPGNYYQIIFICTLPLYYIKRNGKQDIFTEPAHWADSISLSQCPSVCLCATFCSFYKRLITPIYKG